jgi:two-component system, OmpR family, alkaline phosphatase synthesis response regulator PhoP
MSDKKILVAEGYDVARDFLKEKLLSEGYDVETTKDGQETILKIKSFSPEVVVLDSLLPVVGGIEVLKEVREDTDLDRIYIIFASNTGEKEEIDSVKELGVNDYFTKIDFNPEVVVKKVKEFFNVDEIVKEEDHYDTKKETEEVSEINEDNFLLDKDEIIKEDEGLEIEGTESLTSESFQKKKVLEKDIKEDGITPKNDLNLVKKIIFLIVFVIIVSSFFLFGFLTNNSEEIKLTEEERCINENMHWNEGECYEDEETFIFLNNLAKEKECLRDDMYWHEGECYEDEETFIFLNNLAKEKECLRNDMYWEDGECYEVIE